MANPLRGAVQEGGARGPFAGMVQGETRAYTFKSGRTLRITRTRRPFIFDWVDASNDELRSQCPEFVWVVDQNEQPQLRARKFLPPHETR